MVPHLVAEQEGFTLLARPAAVVLEPSALRTRPIQAKVPRPSDDQEKADVARVHRHDPACAQLIELAQGVGAGLQEQPGTIASPANRALNGHRYPGKPSKYFTMALRRGGHAKTGLGCITRGNHSPVVCLASRPSSTVTVSAIGSKRVATRLCGVKRLTSDVHDVDDGPGSVWPSALVVVDRIHQPQRFEIRRPQTLVVVLSHHCSEWRQRTKAGEEVSNGRSTTLRHHRARR